MARSRPVLVDLEAESSQQSADTQELIIRSADPSKVLTPICNRWKFTANDKVIDLEGVQEWDDRLLNSKPRLGNLKKLKVFQLCGERLIRLLRAIDQNESSSLQQLEIDRMELANPKKLKAPFNLKSLITLAIDEIAVVDEKTGEPLEQWLTSISVTFLVPNLLMLQLGKFVS